MRLFSISLNWQNLLLIILYSGSYYSTFHIFTLVTSSTWHEGGGMVVGIDNRYCGTDPGRMVSDESRDRKLNLFMITGCCFLMISLIASCWLMLELAWWLKFIWLIAGTLVAAILGAWIGDTFVLKRVRRRYYDKREQMRSQYETARMQEEQMRIVNQLVKDLGGQEVFSSVLAKMDQKQQEQLSYNINRAAERRVKGYGSDEAEIRFVYALCTQIRDGRKYI